MSKDAAKVFANDDAYIAKTKVLIEQKSFGVDLSKKNFAIRRKT